MPRKNRRLNTTPSLQLPQDGAAYFGTQTQEAFGEIYLVRHMGSAAAKKYYVCPGCNQNIPPGVAHIVAWPRDYGRGADDRRHWHKPCWERRR